MGEAPTSPCPARIIPDTAYPIRAVHPVRAGEPKVTRYPPQSHPKMHQSQQEPAYGTDRPAYRVMIRDICRWCHHQDNGWEGGAEGEGGGERERNGGPSPSGSWLANPPREVSSRPSPRVRRVGDLERASPALPECPIG